MPLDTLKKPDEDTHNPGDRHWDDEFNNIASSQDLKKLENSTNAKYGDSYSKNNSGTKKSGLDNDVRQAEQPDGTWLDNTSKSTKKIPLSRSAVAKLLLKKGGPAGLILALLVIAVGFFGGPATLFLNLTANFNINWDQQNGLSERRMQKMLAKRLSGESTSGVCGKVSLACRYTKPSNKQLKDLETAGVKAVRKDGSIINKQRLLGGERPAYYYTGSEADEASIKKALTDGKDKTNFLAAKDMEKGLRSNPVARNAFRRANNPRWLNWVDDTALKFLAKIGVSKSINKAITEAADSKAMQQAITEIADSKNESLGVDKAEAVRGMAAVESEKFTKTALHNVASKGNEATMAAAVACTGAKAPGVFTTVLRNAKIAAMAGVVFGAVFTPSDSIKAGKGTPKMAENVGNYLTEKGPDGKSAMDSGAVLLGLLGDRGAAQKSTTIKEAIPGYTGNSFLNMAAWLGSSQQVKTACNAATSGEVDVAVNAVRAIELSNPAGWIALTASLGLYIAGKSGALEAILSPVISGIMKAVNNVVDWNSVLEWFTQGFIASMVGAKKGDMIAILYDTVAGNAFNNAGGLPLTPEQKVNYDNEITKPAQLAWAEEDRLNYSPLDASNPNTFMGAMLTKFVGTFGATPSISSLVFGSMSLIGQIPSMVSPAASAGDSANDWTGQCSAEGDFAISNSNVAVDALCVPQYGVPAKYANVDPGDVLDYLFDRHQIDKEGEIIGGSELENLTSLCNSSNTYSLDECSYTGNEEEVRLKAYSVLYKIDKRTVDQMDNDPPSPTGSTGDTGTTQDTGPCAANTIDMGIWDNAHDYNETTKESKKTSIRLCAIPNLPAPAYSTTAAYASIKAVNPDEQSQAEGKALVNARASGAAYNMTEAAKAAGVTLELGTYFAFRTYEHQQELRAAWCAKGDCGGAAEPGKSNHEMGLAIDFDLPGTARSTTRDNSKALIWLRAHANEYGFDDTAMPKEDWHWAYTQ